MFTGIIEQTGTLIGLQDHGGIQRITVEAPGIASRLSEGDSLAISGVCLTALDVSPKYFYADLAKETLEKTTLGKLVAGAKVNLELPVAAGSPLGGHIVQGHVDGTGVLALLAPVNDSSSPDFHKETTDWTFKVKIPEDLRKWMIPKGSVTIEGISLTIAEVEGDTIRVAVLPLTYSRTNLHSLSPGAPLNIEADVLVKMAWQRQLDGQKPEFEVTESWLVANGY
jgi:riboflavin synthase